MKSLQSLIFSLLLVLLGSLLAAQPGSGCETLFGLANALDDANTGPGLKSFIDDLPPGEGGKAWIALKDTPIDSDVYWLGRVNRWQNAELNFNFVYSASPDVVKILRNGDEVAEVLSGGFNIKFSGFGGDILCPLDQTVTVIGRFHQGQPMVGTWYLTKDLKLNRMTHVPLEELTQSAIPGLGRNPGGLNVLDVPNDIYSWDLNRDWLYEAAVVRGDIIRIISDPTDPRTFWKNGIPPGQPGHNGVKTTTKREVEFLEGYGYVYDASIPGCRPN